MARRSIPVTKIKIRVPRGMKVEDVLKKIEIEIQAVTPKGEEINAKVCCVDAAVVSPVSTVNSN